MDCQHFSWIDLHTGKRYRIRTGEPSTPAAIRVQRYGDVVARFRDHPEAKSADSDGNPSDAKTVGMLGRRHVRPLTIQLIGKETNLLEQQEDGVPIADPQAVYPSSLEDETLRARISEISIRELAELSGVSQRMLRDVRAGKRRPSKKAVGQVIDALAELLDS